MYISLYILIAYKDNQIEKKTINFKLVILFYYIKIYKKPFTERSQL